MLIILHHLHHHHNLIILNFNYCYFLHYLHFFRLNYFLIYDPHLLPYQNHWVYNNKLTK